MASIAELIVEIGADSSKFDKEMGKMQGKMKSVGGKMKSIGKGLTAGVTLPIVGIGAAGFAAANDLDKAYKDIRTGTGATGKDLEGLKEDFKAVFEDIPTDSQTAASAISNLNTLTGATGDTLQDLTKNVLEASRTLGEDGVANSEAFGRAMNQWQIPADEGTEKLDGLFKATQDYGIGLGEITSHLNEYGSVLQNAGFSMDQSADLFGKLESSGLSVSRVMPGLNMAFRNWADEGKNVQDELSKTITKIQEAEDGEKALSLATEQFGAEGAQRLVTAIRNGAMPALDDLGASMKNTGGLVESTAEDTKTFGDRMNELKNQTMTALEPVGRIFLDLAEKWLPPVISIVEKLANWFSNLSPTMQIIIVIIGAVVAAIGPLLVVFGAIAGAITTLIPIIMALFSPITVTVALIAALIAIVVYLTVQIVKNWDAIWAKTKEIFGKIIDFFKKWWPLMLGILTGGIGLLVYAIIKNWDKIKEVTKKVWNGIKSFFSNTWDGIKKGAEKFKNVFLGIWGAIKNGIRAVINPIIGFLNSMLGGVESMVNGIASAINRIPSFNVPDWVPGLGGGSFGLPNIPRVSVPRIPSLDVGTNFVASDGLAYLHQGEAVVPKEYNPALGNGMGEKDIVINLTNEIDGETLVEKTIRITARELGELIDDGSRGAV
jgi:TP901 family phage tail tape measure protein